MKKTIAITLTAALCCGCSLAIKTGLGSIDYSTGDTRLKTERTNSVGADGRRRSSWSVDTKADDSAIESDLIFVDPNAETVIPKTGE